MASPGSAHPEVCGGSPISLPDVAGKVGVGWTPDGDEFLGPLCLSVVGYEPRGTSFYADPGLGAGPGQGEDAASI